VGFFGRNYGFLCVYMDGLDEEVFKIINTHNIIGEGTSET